MKGSRIKELRVQLDDLPDYQSNLWPPEDVTILREYYHKKGVRAVAKVLGRSVAAVDGKARRLGL